MKGNKKNRNHEIIKSDLFFVKIQTTKKATSTISSRLYVLYKVPRISKRQLVRVRTAAIFEQISCVFFEAIGVLFYRIFFFN